MRKTKIKKNKKKRYSPLTDKHNRMIPGRVRWQRRGRKFSKTIILTSELIETDKEGKEHELVLAERDALKGIYLPGWEHTQKGLYPERFTNLELTKRVSVQFNAQHWRILKYVLLEYLTNKRIAERENLNRSRITQILKGIWQKLTLNPKLLEDPILMMNYLRMLQKDATEELKKQYSKRLPRELAKKAAIEQGYIIGWERFTKKLAELRSGRNPKPKKLT